MYLSWNNRIMLSKKTIQEYLESVPISDMKWVESSTDGCFSIFIIAGFILLYISNSFSAHYHYIVYYFVDS